MANAAAGPLCHSDDVEIVADLPATLLRKCQKCATAFTIAHAVRTSLPGSGQREISDQSPLSRFRKKIRPPVATIAFA
jgi:hypothetical protein